MALETSASHLRFFLITEDVPKEKQGIFNGLKEPIQKVLNTSGQHLNNAGPKFKIFNP